MCCSLRRCSRVIRSEKIAIRPQRRTVMVDLDTDHQPTMFIDRLSPIPNSPQPTAHRLCRPILAITTSHIVDTHSPSSQCKTVRRAKERHKAAHIELLRRFQGPVAGPPQCACGMKELEDLEFRNLHRRNADVSDSLIEPMARQTGGSKWPSSRGRLLVGELYSTP